MNTYPLFTPKFGNLTKKIQTEYIIYYINLGKLSKESLSNIKIISLNASNNPEDEIYFWQLYSIIGEAPIHNLIEKFYTNIFNDKKNIWFSEEFIDTGTIKYHVRGQKNFWLDIMGGGPHYKGGELKLHKKHKLVDNIMNTESAIIWMNHMINSLDEVGFNKIKDKRIIKCIKKLLYFFINKYSVEFDFNFFTDNINSKL